PVSTEACGIPHGGVKKVASVLRRRLLQPLVLAALLLLGACSTLPGHGPEALEIGGSSHTASLQALPYVVVQLDPATVSASNHYRPPSFQTEFRDAFGGSRAMSVGVGDRLTVNIWEPSADGVFATAEKKQTSLTATVDEEGMIYIPYAGRVHASGRHVEGLRRAIEQALHGKAVEPQVQVVLEENASNKVVLVGDVARPGQYAVPLQGLRLMEAIAQAGGTKAPVFETVATITRGRHRGTLRLDQVASMPANNIRLAPSDSIVVEHRPRSYSAFGAVQQVGLMAFPSETMSMAEALAQVKGLRNDNADAGGIFLFRFEEKGLAHALQMKAGASGTAHE